jgi:hypothetical protein
MFKLYHQHLHYDKMTPLGLTLYWSCDRRRSSAGACEFLIDVQRVVHKLSEHPRVWALKEDKRKGRREREEEEEEEKEAEQQSTQVIVPAFIVAT